MLPCKWWQVCHINVKQQWSKDTALWDPLVAREERRRLVVDHYPLLPIVKKISEPAKSCAANATGLQSQEQVLMQNIVECLWQVDEDSGCVLFLVTSLEPVIESCKEEIWARVRSSFFSTPSKEHRGVTTAETMEFESVTNVDMVDKKDTTWRAGRKWFVPTDLADGVVLLARTNGPCGKAVSRQLEIFRVRLLRSILSFLLLLPLCIFSSLFHTCMPNSVSHPFCLFWS